MMRRTLGAPLGGTTRGGQYGVESAAFSLITPPNGSGGGGICFPSIVTVASGAPGTPLICWARTMPAIKKQTTPNSVPTGRLRGTRFIIDILRALCFCQICQAATLFSGVITFLGSGIQTGSIVFGGSSGGLTHLQAHESRDQYRQIELTGDSFRHRRIASLQAHRSNVAGANRRQSSEAVIAENWKDRL